MANPQTSEHGGFIRGLADEMDSSGAPVCTAVTRAGIVNNLNHLLDSAGQQIANLASVAATDMQLPASTSLALFPELDLVCHPRLRSGDGSTYRVVIYMRAYASAASTVTFRLALRPDDHTRYTRPPDPGSFTTTWVAEVSTASTTGADLTATLYLSAAQVAAMTPWPVSSEDGGNVEAEAYVHPCRLQVWAKSSGAGLPTVVVFTAREFCGSR